MPRRHARSDFFLRHGFSVALTPKTFDAQHRAVFVDTDGVVRVEEDKPATRQSPPLGK